MGFLPDKEKIKYPPPVEITLKERLKRRKGKKQARKQKMKNKRRK